MNKGLMYKSATLPKLKKDKMSGQKKIGGEYFSFSIENLKMPGQKLKNNNT